jgi:hypothetical protein
MQAFYQRQRRAIAAAGHLHRLNVFRHARLSQLLAALFLIVAAGLFINLHQQRTQASVHRDASAGPAYCKLGMEAAGVHPGTPHSARPLDSCAPGAPSFVLSRRLGVPRENQ